MDRPRTAGQLSSDPTWYLGAMEHLLQVVQALSQARGLEDVTAIVRDAARDLTGADGATFVLRDGDQCYYMEENAIAPLWKGRRFPMSACVSGWVMRESQPAVIEDVASDPRVPFDAYRPTFVKSMAMVPVRRGAPIGAIGNYWAARRRPTREEVAILQALGDTTAVALQNADLYAQLRGQVRTLQSQQDRIREQRDTIEVFARALAHDLKEPVRTLRSYSRLAGDPVEGEGHRDECLRFIQAAAERMDLLVDSVLRYVQLDGTLEPTAGSCDVGEVAAAVRQDLGQLIFERGAILEIDPLPRVRAHPAHIAQVLQNLVANAVRHNPPGTRVRISADRRDDGWRICVRDSGTGIPESQTRKIFQPFVRLGRKEQGAGLGLSVCEKIVGGYGGRIWCESGSAGGAAFCFTLPEPPGLHDARGDAASEMSEEPLACLLLVDDMPEDLMLNQMTLARRAKLNCRILTAEDGEKALEILARERVDLVLLDINMPRLDGFEALDRMRRNEATRHIAVVMCTGSNYEKDKERARNLGAAGYVLKPASADSLLGAIQGIPSLRLRGDNGRYDLLRVATPA